MRGDVMLIRNTTDGDIPEILALVRAFHAENLDEYGLSCDDGVAMRIIPMMVKTSLVLVADGKIRGVIAGFVTNHIVDSKKLFQEVIWFVSKEYRKYGLKLIEHMERFCKKMGCEHMVMVTLGDKMRDKLDKFYSKNGYKYLETQYIKAL